jgi:hypothetical protein
MFFMPEKVVVNSPRLPRIPPQIHHDLPPRCTTKSSKTPAKCAITTLNKKTSFLTLKASDG